MKQAPAGHCAAQRPDLVWSRTCHAKKQAESRACKQQARKQDLQGLGWWPLLAGSPLWPARPAARPTATAPAASARPPPPSAPPPAAAPAAGQGTARAGAGAGQECCRVQRKGGEEEGHCKVAPHLIDSDFGGELACSHSCRPAHVLSAAGPGAALGPKSLPPTHLESDLHIAWRPAPAPQVAAATQPQHAALVRPGRHPHAQQAPLPPHAVPRAGGAGLGEAHATPAAGGACGRAPQPHACSQQRRQQQRPGGGLEPQSHKITSLQALTRCLAVASRRGIRQGEQAQVQPKAAA